MVKTQKVDGEHREKESAEPETTETQLKMMLSQDQRYVNMKKTAELRINSTIVYLFDPIRYFLTPRNRWKGAWDFPFIFKRPL